MMDLAKLTKEHEKLFPNATIESQIWKLEEEILEWTCADDDEIDNEIADIMIVCAGLARWCPRTAFLVVSRFLDDKWLEEKVKEKWEINKKRKWEWNGKTYHHVEESDENNS